MKPIKIFKFGGTSLKDDSARKHVIKILKKEAKNYRLVVVVSAMGRLHDPYATDTLLAFGNYLNAKDKDSLLSCGELISCGVLCNECLKEGMSCCCVNFIENGIYTNQNYLDGDILNVNSDSIYNYLKKYHLVIIPGFFGTNQHHFVTSLGRGGSDLAAVAIANSLGLKEVYIYSDVAGIYSTDPKQYPFALFYDEINIHQLIEIAYYHNPIVAYKACLYALRNHIQIHLKSTFDDTKETVVNISSLYKNFLITFNKHLFCCDKNGNIFDLGNEIDLKDAHKVIIEENLT